CPAARSAVSATEGQEGCQPLTRRGASGGAAARRRKKAACGGSSRGGDCHELEGTSRFAGGYLRNCSHVWQRCSGFPVQVYDPFVELVNTTANTIGAGAGEFVRYGAGSVVPNGGSGTFGFATIHRRRS